MQIKKTAGVLSVCILSISMLLACSKPSTNDTPTPTPTPTKAFSATIGGVLFETDSTEASFLTDGITGIKRLYIGGSLKNGTGLGIGMPDQTVPGTYSMVPGSGYSMTYVLVNKGDYYSSSGTLKITSNANKTIEGTFSGVLEDANGVETLDVKDGKFKVKY